MNSPKPTDSSPSWSSTSKLLMGMTIVAICFGLAIYFRSIIGPLLLVFIVTYLLHPITNQFSRLTHFSWKLSANIIFFVLLVLLGGLSTLTGVALIQQVQSLIRTIQGFSDEVPTLIQQLTTQTFVLGPFQVNLGQYLDLSSLSTTLLNALQTLLGRVGTLVTTVASGAASTVGWSLFVLLISYFILIDAEDMPGFMQRIEIPGYKGDLARMMRELGQIWNAFLRGQLIIISLVIIAYTVVLSILGVRFALGLAALAGLARLVPYLGPLVTNTVTFLVALLQTQIPFGLEPLAYAVMVIVIMLIIDQIFDNFISPRIMGESLGVHPAALLVAAVIATNLIGIIGLLMAAPVLASLRLLAQYIFRKMLDQDPWPETIYKTREKRAPLGARLWRWLRLQSARIRKK